MAIIQLIHLDDPVCRPRSPLQHFERILEVTGLQKSFLVKLTRLAIVLDSARPQTLHHLLSEAVGAVVASTVEFLPQLADLDDQRVTTTEPHGQIVKMCLYSRDLGPVMTFPQSEAESLTERSGRDDHPLGEFTEAKRAQFGWKFHPHLLPRVRGAWSSEAGQVDEVGEFGHPRALPRRPAPPAETRSAECREQPRWYGSCLLLGLPIQFKLLALTGIEVYGLAEAFHPLVTSLLVKKCSKTYTLNVKCPTLHHLLNLLNQSLRHLVVNRDRRLADVGHLHRGRHSAQRGIFFYDNFWGFGREVMNTGVRIPP
ncbi:hypothetical protein PR001_g22554 [Phytophthora rubi]|uniref:Uncharacterized protein n=1 Tax=Phytophthora rubi TaxID=129364 RepID=A0A6A3J233_9STRA|nr:hypothetical protein PR001_g22554 [Phytophthora rubi]